MNYGIVVFPSKPIQDFANSYRKRYDPNYALIPPHITLKSSFEADSGQLDTIVEQLYEVANQSKPFDIQITKFSSFQPVNNVIYLKIEPKTHLELLHKEIDERFPEHPTTEYSYVPHITVGQKLSNAEHSDIYGSLRLQRVDQLEKVDRFHLLYQLENGSWTVYETFRFGKE
jgi:2'-5' RNA ligase